MDSPVGITLCELLDPRPSGETAERGIVGAVNIPVAELAARMHELPPRRQLLRVADVGEACAAAVAWLRNGGRAAEPVDDFDFAARGAGARPGRLWRPTAFLEEVTKRVRPGAALDVACGSGRDAVYLAALGWDVSAVDWLPDALVMGATLAARYGAAVRPIRWLRVDLERMDGPVLLDGEAVPLEFGAEFHLICAFRYLHRALMPRLVRWLATRGSLVCETFTTLHRERHGKPARDAHILQPGELRSLAGALRIRQHDEAWRADGSHTARLWAGSQA